MDKPSSPLSGTLQGHYRIEGLVAAGGMGQVYRAVDTRLQRPVAIKAIQAHFVADAVARERFLRETRLACRVNHPYVATVYDVLETGDQPLLVMEFIEGHTLSQTLQAGRSDPSQIWLWLIEIVDALAAIHRAGVVHRDLKPANVMITKDGHVKVMDFGLSRIAVDKAVDPESSTLTQYATLTREGAVLGTLLYASPEQLRGEKAGRRSDLFSLGILMYESLYGAHPFGRKTGPESLSAILHESPSGGSLPPMLRESGHVEQLLKKLLNKSPGQRPTDTDAVLAELRTMPGTSGFADSLQLPARRSWKFAGLPIIILALLVAAGFWWLKQPPVWERSRVALAVAPFDDETNTPEGRVAASMVADLLAVDLQASLLIRARGPEDLQQLLSSLPTDLQPRELATRLSTGLSVDYVATGRIYREGKNYVAAVEFQPCKPGLGEIPGLRFSATTPLLLAEKLGSGLRKRLPDVSRLTAMRDDRTDLSEITSDSEEARSLLAQGVLSQRAGRLTESIQFYEDAVNADPNFALGFARLAGGLNQAGYGRKARDAAATARSLAPEASSRAAARLRLFIRSIWAEAFERPAERTEAARELAEMFPDEPALLYEYSNALSNSEQYTEALEFADRALVLDTRNAELRLARASLLRLCNRPDEALEALDEVEALFQLVSNEEGWAAVIRVRGRVMHDQERYADAVETLGLAAQRFTDGGRDLAAAETWLEVVNIDLELGNLEAAEPRIERARLLAEKVGNRKLVSEALSTQAVLSQLGRDYESAVRLYRESIDIGRQLEQSSLLADPVSNLSSLLVWLGRLEEARPVLEQAVEIANELGRKDMLQVALINSAEIGYRLGKLDDARRYYDALLTTEADEQPTRLATFGYLGLAAIYRHQGQLEKALATLDLAVEEYQARAMKVELGRALLNRARTRSILGRHDAAVKDIDRATAAADTFPELKVDVDLVRIEMDINNGDYELALVKLAAHPDRTTKALLLLESCRAYVGLRRFTNALGSCRAALATADIPNAERVAVKAWLGRVLAGAGKHDEAWELSAETLKEASTIGLPLEHARASVAAVSAAAAAGASDENNARALCENGLSSLQRFIEGAPAADRPALKAMPDLVLIEAALSNCGQ